MQPFGRHDMGQDQCRQRGKCRRAGANPVRQRGDIKVDPFTGKRLALPVQRQVLAKLGFQDRGQQFGAGAAAGDRMERRRRLSDAVAGAAAEFLAHRLDHLKPARDHLQRLGDVLAKLGELATAARAGHRRRDHHALTRQVRRQRAAHRLASRDAFASRLVAGRIGACRILASGSFKFFELELQLIEQLASAFG